MDVNANLFREGSALTTVDPATRIPAYTLVDLNLWIGAEDGAWRLGVFARNLFDTYFMGRITRPFDGYLNSPAAEARRTIGVQLSFAGR